MSWIKMQPPPCQRQGPCSFLSKAASLGARRTKINTSVYLDVSLGCTRLERRGSKEYSSALSSSNSAKDINSASALFFK